LYTPFVSNANSHPLTNNFVPFGWIYLLPWPANTSNMSPFTCHLIYRWLQYTISIHLNCNGASLIMFCIFWVARYLLLWPIAAHLSLYNNLCDQWFSDTALISWITPVINWWMTAFPANLPLVWLFYLWYTPGCLVPLWWPPH
jgi:hypothetical protein